MLALIQAATLGGDAGFHGGCLWIEGTNGDRRTVIWPHGYRAAFDPVLLIDPDGKVVAAAGDKLNLGGGIVSQPPTKDLQRCVVSSEIWLANSVRRVPG